MSSPDYTSNIKIVLIGSGNVAWHLGSALADRGHQVCQVVSRHPSNAIFLSQHINAESATFETIDREADLYLICVSDDSIPEVASHLSFLNGDQVVAHTAGSVDSTVLKEIGLNFGVIYPLQTLTKSRKVDMSEVPFFICGSNQFTENFLLQISDQLGTAHLVSDEQRLHLHLAAVVSCNFVNHLYGEASRYLKANDLDFKHLHPLIAETMKKAIDEGPENAQTGPALRGDRETMKKHLDLLNGDKRLRKLYKMMSKSISKESKKKD